MYKILLVIIALFLVISFYPKKQESSDKISNTKLEENLYEVVSTNLKIPWEIVFLPNGDMLVTERAGNVLRIGKDKKTISKISGVRHIGEGGLLGMALDHDFKNNNFVYLYSTYTNSDKILNRVERYQLDNDELKNRFTVVDGIKGSKNHDGGRIAFGPDNYLYITTGDAEEPNLAQNKNSLNGKILRVGSDGKIEVYSYGHRNPQGLAWDSKGNLWATEHGPSGVQTGNDEINLIVKGGNYGWPIIKGEKKKDGMITPTLESGTLNAWAPSGMVIVGDNIFFAGLRGEALYQAKIINNDNLNLVTHFKNEFGRIRTVKLGPDGNLYLLTNNTDGRGKPKEGDDKIIRVSVEKLLSP